MPRLEGVFPVLPTPFKPGGEPDADALLRLADWAIACGYLPEQSAVEQSPGKTFPWTTAIVGPGRLPTLDQVQLGGHPDVLPARLIKHSMHLWWKRMTGRDEVEAHSPEKGHCDR